MFRCGKQAHWNDSVDGNDIEDWAQLIWMVNDKFINAVDFAYALDVCPHLYRMVEVAVSVIKALGNGNYFSQGYGIKVAHTTMVEQI